MAGVSSPPPPGAYWADGGIVAAGTAAVSPIDHAVIVGAGVFETLKVVDGVLVTPPLSSGCLAGITRELVLELTDAVERDVELGEFTIASEAFLTSSTREVGAISAVDDTVLPEAPGPVTAEVAAAFANLVATNPDP